MKIKFKNFLGTIESFFRTDATGVRTYQFQDRDGIIADNTDLFNKVSLQGDYDISVNTFPPGALYGYAYFTALTNSTSLFARDGGVIPKGCFLISKKVSGAASTVSYVDWIIIPTQY